MRSLAGLFCLFWIASVGGLKANDAEQVVILVNSEDSASTRIGIHYAEARGIPKKNIISLALPTQETITLDEYVNQVSNPLLLALIEDGWVDGVKAQSSDAYGRIRLALARHSIRYLVLIRGVPLRIENAPESLSESEASLPKQFKVTRASVDSELSLLLGPPGVSMAALIPNPLLEKPNLQNADTGRLLFVNRLDGPSEKAVIRLIDRTIEGEQKGLMGRAYFDVGGPHKKGDQWLRAAGELAEAAYFDVSYEATKREMDFRDRLDAPAIYMGWYKPNAYGPWAESSWSVPPGAIGFHLHSFSAKTVRSTKKGWLGAFVQQGYSLTVGNVFEPYLEFTHHPDDLLKYLLDGASFGDAAMWSNPALSWQSVALGDPLYRPFQVGLDAQLESGMSDVFSGYMAIREANRLSAEAREEDALQYLKKAFVEKPSLALSLKLATLFISAGQPDRAVESLKYIQYTDRYPMDDLVVVKRIADLLFQHDQTDIAFEVYGKLLETSSVASSLKEILLEDGVVIADKAGEFISASRWSLELQKLRAPSPEL